MKKQTSASKNQLDSIAAPTVKEASNGKLSLDGQDLTVIIPASVNLKHYDLLTVHWSNLSGEEIGKSYPIPITEETAGKEYVYIIPNHKIPKLSNSLMQIWFSFHQVGSDKVNSSPFLNLVIEEHAKRKNEDSQTIPEKASLNDIVYAKIHPGIGMARVGNSKSEFYVGPEYANAPPPAFGSTRDSAGAIKRQAARFRIYGYNKDGVAIAELTPANANIQWSVELANKKSSWYVFDSAMDQPKARSVPRRNPLIAGAARKTLEITPAVKTISGTDSKGIYFDDGKFKETAVNLGELRTDTQGRLLVLGGDGRAESPSGAPLLVIDDEGEEQNFNNSVDWYDNISDGPVSAKVNLSGRDIPVTDSWVVVGPPDYAPGITPFRSLFDMIKAVSTTAGIIAPETQTSYTRDILPLLLGLSNLQWVNMGFAKVFGPGGTFPIDSNLITELPKLHNSKLRHEVFSKFRAPNDPSVAGGDDLKWPQLYGDGFEALPLSQYGDLLPVSPESYLHLVKFVGSQFVNDLDEDEFLNGPEFPHMPYAKPVDQRPVAEQPSALDEGPLSYCCADAFHPGCELTWPMRHISLYSDFLRIKKRKAGEEERNYGDVLTPAQAIASDGPVNAQGPGDLTRWMAVPWHGDTARCRSGYDKEFHPFLPSFWPAKVPNEVLSEKNYRTFVNTGLSEEIRNDAFQQRDYWQRAFLLEGLDNETVMQNTVSRFDELGIVQRLPTAPDQTSLINGVFVEQLKPGMPPLPELASVFSGRIDGTSIPNREELLAQIGWTEEAWKKYRRTL